MKNYLWQEGDGQIDQTIMEFMAGEDVILDRELFRFRYPGHRCACSRT